MRIVNVESVIAVSGSKCGDLCDMIDRDEQHLYAVLVVGSG
jgi:hypothetical protein